MSRSWWARLILATLFSTLTYQSDMLEDYGALYYVQSAAPCIR